MMILVTGASGFVASYVIRELLEKGRDLVLTGRRFREMKWDGIPFEGADIRLRKDLDCLDRYRVNAVVHCAAALMIDRRNQAEYYFTNALGTFNVLDWAKKNNVQKFILLHTHSDMNAYPEIFLPDDAESCFRPEDSMPFITSKIAAAQMVRSCIENGVFDGHVLRLANIRGVGSRDEKYNCVFHQFIQKAIAGEPIELWGERKTVRDLIYVKDVARAVVMALESPGGHGVINIGSGVGMTIEDEAAAIIEVFSDPQRRSPIVLRPDIPEVRKHSLIFDIAKAKRMLGWEPVYSYREGLEDMKNLMREV
jgi:UDP-glucose 4-epimerase